MSADIVSYITVYNALTLLRVLTDIKMLFSRSCKGQIPGFFMKILFSRTLSIHKHGFHEVKKVHVQNQLSVYICIIVKKRKCNT